MILIRVLLIKAIVITTSQVSKTISVLEQTYPSKTTPNRITTISSLQTLESSAANKTSSNSCRVLRVTRIMQRVVRRVVQPSVLTVKKVIVREEIQMSS